jgi:hypothetical protein
MNLLRDLERLDSENRLLATRMQAAAASSSSSGPNSANSSIAFPRSRSGSFAAGSVASGARRQSGIGAESMALPEAGEDTGRAAPASRRPTRPAPLFYPHIDAEHDLEDVQADSSGGDAAQRHIDEELRTAERDNARAIAAGHQEAEAAARAADAVLGAVGRREGGRWAYSFSDESGPSSIPVPASFVGAHGATSGARGARGARGSGMGATSSSSSAMPRALSNTAGPAPSEEELVAAFEAALLPEGEGEFGGEEERA